MQAGVVSKNNDMILPHERPQPATAGFIGAGGAGTAAGKAKGPQQNLNQPPYYGVKFGAFVCADPRASAHVAGKITFVAGAKGASRIVWERLC